MLPEPDRVFLEAVFEDSIAGVVAHTLKEVDVRIVRHFGLDMAIFKLVRGTPLSLFIEVKSCKAQRLSCVGFGNGRGKGPQVDLLLGDDLSVLDQSVRWAFVDATLPTGTNRYALLNCTNARAAVMGTVTRGKQNNFSIACLSPHLVAWDDYFKTDRGFRQFLPAHLAR